MRTGSGFNYTVYLLSPRFPALHEENLLVLDEMHPEIKAYLEVVREIVRTHFKERREALSAELFLQCVYFSVDRGDGQSGGLSVYIIVADQIRVPERHFVAGCQH